jgi:alkanesulfonate monooxygenase SsuD/methylene tetrahydromethanopterin reductase-like flavin-dependent oxidoreductase (luciferase family)
MRFGLFYEHQLPKPWGEDAEYRLYQEALEQVEVADRVGIDMMWEVEHHSLEEYSHSSAPKVFLGACSQRTKRIRLGHGIALMPPAYNHPARVAERIATLDLVSHGRVEWGTGESASLMEMEGFGINPPEKTAMWREATEQAANMLAMRPYPGFKGEYFDMPCRNLVPKPLQRPHPPAWVACSKRETIHRAARNGLGALAFAFVEPEMAAKWVQEYYDIIRSEECVPLTHTVNPNIALVSGMMCHPDAEEAVTRGLDGFKFFGYSLGYFGIYGEIKPGYTDIWSRYMEVRDTLEDNAGRGGIGTPEQVRQHLLRYERAGVDQIIFVKQSGKNRHDHICESLELFGREVLPEFAERDAARQVRKQEALAPYIAAALARKPRMAPLAEADVPVFIAPGRRSAAVGDARRTAFADRALPIPATDPHAKLAKAQGD